MINYKEKRKELGLTQAEVAEMAGIGLRTLQYIEVGACSPKLEQWYALQTILNKENDGRFYFVWNPDRLREFRKTRKLTQAELAEKAGVSLTTVVSWENDITPTVPTVDNLNKICLIFQKPVDMFLTRKEKADHIAPRRRMSA